MANTDDNSGLILVMTPALGERETDAKVGEGKRQHTFGHASKCHRQVTREKAAAPQPLQSYITSLRHSAAKLKGIDGALEKQAVTAFYLYLAE